MHKRLFIAISYDNNPALQAMQHMVLDRLEPVVKQHNGVIRPQKHVHMTLFFLGERPIEQIPEIIQEFEQIVLLHTAKHELESLRSYASKFSLRLLGVGVVALVIEPSDTLLNLAAELANSFGDKNNQRTFLPHITLARIKKVDKNEYESMSKESSFKLNEIAREFQEPFIIHAEDITLFSSQESDYKEIKSFKI